MTYAALIRDRMAGWTHGSARGNPIEQARHEAFIFAHLSLALFVLALVPPYMALRGGLSIWQAVIVVCALAQFGGVLALTRGGDYFRALTISVTSLLIAGVAIAAATGGLTGPALAWLMLTPFESMSALSRRFVAKSTGLAVCAVCAILGAQALGWFGAASPTRPGAALLFVAPAFLYAALLATSAMRAYFLRGRLERAGVAQYQTLATAMGDLVMRHDRGGAVLYASKESYDLFGLQSRELMGRGMFERLLVQDRPLFLKAIADASERDATITCELRMKTGAAPSQHGDFNEPVFSWIEFRARRIPDAGGETGKGEDGARVLSVVRNIVSKKRHEQEIETARAEAERANAWKDRFLANVSHELRTPLNAIIGFSEILGNDDLTPADPEKRKEYAGIIHGSGRHLLEVVNSILDISKIEAGRFSITPEPFEVRPLVESCCDMVSLKAQQVGVSISRDIPDHLDELTADKRACRQVLINLLGNALKFTPRGGAIVVGARQEPGHIAMFVSDNGCGMSPYDLPRLGGAFFQAGAANDRTYEGTGLGLSVVRGLVGLHGGEIQVESGPGAGTCVTVRLPVDCRGTLGKPASARIIVIPREAAPADAVEVSDSAFDPVRKRA